MVIETKLECQCCFEDETVEYISNAQSFRCEYCGAHWHMLALNNLHYFANGEVHRKEGIICYSH